MYLRRVSRKTLEEDKKGCNDVPKTKDITGSTRYTKEVTFHEQSGLLSMLSKALPGQLFNKPVGRSEPNLELVDFRRYRNYAASKND